MTLSTALGSNRVALQLDDVTSIEKADALAIPAGRHRIRIEASDNRRVEV